MDAVYWEKLSSSPNVLVAAQNRMSSNLFGFAGINATWYYAYTTFHSPTAAEALAEMMKVHAPSGTMSVTHVLIDRSMKDGALLRPWETAKPLSLEAIKKFESAPFVKLFDNGEVQIYLVDWNYT
jgi:hypothetical protein